jgi:CO/xanthine dehydrogenase FAD-binding subunit
MGNLTFYHPRNLEEALAFLSQEPAATKVVAGATDLFLQVKESQGNTKYLVDLVGVRELQFIREGQETIDLGPTLTLNQAAQNPLLRTKFPGLAEAAIRIGSPQIRNRGTLGGNMGRASPAGDCSVALLCLGAGVTLRSARSTRMIPLAEFFQGPGRHAGQADELISEIILPVRPERSGSSFVKLGKRKTLILAVAAVAAYLELDENANIKEARIALGSVAPTPCRGPHAEKSLVGRPVSIRTFEESGQAALSDISPIDDLRASADYRRMVIPVLVRRALVLAAQRAGAILLS